MLVHGGAGPELTWADQRQLAGRWTLVIPWRRGFWPSPGGRPPGLRGRPAADIATLLEAEGGARLVGFSYGGVGAALAAARRPGLVRSLTLIEPALLGVLPGDRQVHALVTLSAAALAGEAVSLARFLDLAGLGRCRPRARADARAGARPARAVGGPTGPGGAGPGANAVAGPLGRPLARDREGLRRGDAPARRATAAPTRPRPRRPALAAVQPSPGGVPRCGRADDRPRAARHAGRGNPMRPGGTWAGGGVASLPVRDLHEPVQITDQPAHRAAADPAAQVLRGPRRGRGRCGPGKGGSIREIDYGAEGATRFRRRGPCL